MKKLRIALIALVLALAAVGVAACTDNNAPASEHCNVPNRGGGNY